ncbi:MAG: TraK domain-containing protein [Candidatus Lariskella arthropodorum]
MNIFKYFVLLVWAQGTLCSISFGKAYEYMVSSTQILTVPISKDHINRLMFNGDRILKVIGHLDDFQIESDSTSGSFFITSNLGIGESTTVTVLTESGAAQDIKFKIVSASEPSVATIKRVHIGVPKTSYKTTQSFEDNIISSLKDVMSGRTTCYVFSVLDASDMRLENYEISKVVEYRSRSLRIKKIEYSYLKGEVDLKKIAGIDSSILAAARARNEIYLVFIA